MFRSKQKTKFLFTDERQSFPVVEFKASHDESLNIPSFILETTWPRVLYFYYPNLPRFEFFHSNYVQVARRMRHESDILVKFYAISCAAHSTMCSNSDLLNKIGEPVLKAYESGSILGTEILIEESSDKYSRSSTNMVIQQLSKALSLGNLIENAPEELISLTQSKHLEDKGSMFKGENTIQETYNDALKAFILTMQYNIYGDLEKASDYGSLKLPKNKADILKDFLDLCYWSLPPSWEIHTVLFNLRSEFASAIDGPSNLKSIISNQYKIDMNSWSKDCGRETIEYSSFSCGLWKLLHIISVGANEASTHVMGDIIRAKPAYVALVIRDFISEFIPPDERSRHEEFLNTLEWCPGCRHNVISSFDSCKHGALCIDRVRDLQQEYTTVVAEWLWEMHIIDESKPPEKRLELLREQFAYDNLKQLYWPSDKNVRIAVLKPFIRDLPIIKHSRSGHQFKIYFILTSLILMCIYSLKILRGVIYKRMKKN